MKLASTYSFYFKVLNVRKEIQGIIYAKCSNLYKEIEVSYVKIKVF